MAGVFERAPHFLKQQPVLRIDVERLAGRDVEKRGVKLVHAFEHPGGAGINLARFAGHRIKKRINVPTVARNFADAVNTVLQIVPELSDGPRTGKASGHADHGDGFRNAGRSPWLGRRNRFGHRSTFCG